MDRRREDVRYLRDTAVRLLEIAADMEDGPAEPDVRLEARCEECDGTGKFFYCYADLSRNTDELADCLTCKGTGQRPGGVSLAKLAAEQAIRDFLAEDPDNDEDDRICPDLELPSAWGMPDIASTYRGRR